MGKAGIGKGFWNKKLKLELTTHNEAAILHKSFKTQNNVRQNIFQIEASIISEKCLKHLLRSSFPVQSQTLQTDIPF